MSRRKLIQFVDNAGNSVRAISHPLVAGGDSHHCTVRIAIQKLPSDCPTFVGTRSVMVGVTVTRFTHDNSARLWAFQYLCRELGYLIATNLRQGTVGNRARNLLFLHSGARDSFVTPGVRVGVKLRHCKCEPAARQYPQKFRTDEILASFPDRYFDWRSMSTRIP